MSGRKGRGGGLGQCMHLVRLTTSSKPGMTSGGAADGGPQATAGRVWFPVGRRHCLPPQIQKTAFIQLPALPFFPCSAASEEVENGWMKISRQNDWGIDEEASWEDAAVAL